jgi:hypothetical protein
MQRIIDRYIPRKGHRAVQFGIVFLVGIPVVIRSAWRLPILIAGRRPEMSLRIKQPCREHLRSPCRFTTAHSGERRAGDQGTR